MRTLTLMALVALIAAVAQGQSARYDSVALGVRGPIAGATIAVCTQPASTGTAPCSPLATLATSTSTTSGGANPLTADALGNFHFYAAPGIYTIQIYGPQVALPYVMTDVGVGPGNTGAVKPAASDAVQFVSTNGNDSNDGFSRGSAKLTFSAAYSALPATGGWIYAGCGTFSLSSTLNFNTNSKPVKFIGSGPCTILNYTPSTGTAILLDTGGGNPAQSSLLSDFTLQTTVVGSTATGLQVGSVNTAKGSVIQRVHITGFKTLAESNAFQINWNQDDLNTCSNASGSAGLLIAATQDDNHFFGGSISGCTKAVDMSTGSAGPAHFLGTEFFSTSGASILDVENSNVLYCVNCHLVNSANVTPIYLTEATNANVIFDDSIWEDDATSGSYTDVATVSASALTMNNSRIIYSGASSTEAVLFSGASQATFRSMVNTSGTLWNLSYTGGPVNDITPLFPTANPSKFANPISLLSSSGGSILHQAPNTAAAITVTDPVATTLTPVAATCTMTTTTCTITVVSGAAHCVATDSGGTIAGQCSISGTTLTVTAASSNTSAWSVLWW